MLNKPETVYRQKQIIDNGFLIDAVKVMLNVNAVGG